MVALTENSAGLGLSFDTGYYNIIVNKLSPQPPPTQGLVGNRSERQSKS